MTDFISREAAFNAILNLVPKVDDDGYCWVIRGDAATAIDSIPAADVRPVVRGEWNRTDAYPHRLYCSVCYKTYLKNDELLERWEFSLNFCPNCGADMRLEPPKEREKAR